MAPATLLAGALSATPGCTSHNCSCELYVCQRVLIDRTPALGPDSYITWDGELLPLMDVAGRLPQQDGTCLANLEGLDTDSRPDQPPPEIWQQIYASCASGGIHVVFGVDLDDVRELGVGPHEILFGGWHGPLDDPILHLQLQGSLEVEEAVGAADAFPEMVTPDFRRVLRLDVTPWDVNLGAPNIGASLRFTLTARAFHGFPVAICEECSC